MKKILFISTSLRNESNSEMLLDACMAGAKSSGNIIDKVTLKEKTFSFCKGCLSCQKTYKCVIQDDANLIVEKMREADVLVFATPIYYYEMSGQLKTLLDRANPLFNSEYSFRDVYLLTSAADEDESAYQRAENGLKGWIDCFEKARFAGSVFAGGVTDAGDIQEHPALQKAYEMGVSIR